MLSNVLTCNFLTFKLPPNKPTRVVVSNCTLLRTLQGMYTYSIYVRFSREGSQGSTNYIFGWGGGCMQNVHQLPYGGRMQNVHQLPYGGRIQNVHQCGQLICSVRIPQVNPPARAAEGSSGQQRTVGGEVAGRQQVEGFVWRPRQVPDECV